MDVEATTVGTCLTMKERKKKAKENHSIISKRMWNMSLHQVVLPMLHIILGITRKLFDVCILELQIVDKTSFIFVNLMKVYDILTYFVSEE